MCKSLVFDSFPFACHNRAMEKDDMEKEHKDTAGNTSSRPNNLIQHTTELAMHIVSAYVHPGDVVIDATCGNGHDTLRLAEMQPSRLYAFDLQPEAIEATGCLLHEHGFTAGGPDDRIILTCLGHEHMGDYFRAHPVPAGSSGTTDVSSPAESSGAAKTIGSSGAAASEAFAAAIVFNLGYLPGGDKAVTTCAGTTLSAVQQALALLRTGGLLCLTMYSGHPGGSEEKRALLAFARGLDSRQWHVSYISMPNQRKAPPEILLISRKK